jgi:hypothetical protein
MNLPTFPGLSDQEITRVTDALLEALGGRQGA